MNRRMVHMPDGTSNNLGSIRLGSPLPLNLSHGADKRTAPITSIAHLGQGTPASSSDAAHAWSRVPATSMRGNNTTGVSSDDAETNRLRDTFIAKRMKIKQKQAVIAAAVKKTMAKNSPLKLDVAPGRMQRKTGVTSFERGFKHFVRTHRSTFSNLVNAKDGKKKLDFFTGIVKDKIDSKKVGSKWERHDRLDLNKKIKKAHDSGEILLQDKKMMNKIVNTTFKSE